MSKTQFLHGWQKIEFMIGFYFLLVHRMGSCKSVPQLSREKADLLKYAKIEFQPTFTHPSVYPMMEINSATFTDVWTAMNDWNMGNKEYEHVQNVLRTYMKEHTCIDKYIVVIYRKQAWQFRTVYNDSAEQYRIITILPLRRI